jgi:ATP-dependent DNA helicase RecG
MAATLADLDLDLFRREYLPHSVDQQILAQNERPEEQQLLSLRCTSPSSPPVPTVLGILVLGKDPRQFVPSSYVQFLRIEGTDLTDPVKHQQEIDGPLPELLFVLDKVLEAQVSVAADVSQQVREIRRPDYPLAALRQFSSNAVLHRTYEGTNAPVRITWFSDRLEIQNPGGPYGQVNRQNFGQPGITDYRNPHLAEAMKNLGYVQRFGLGIPLAQQELARNGNPPAEFLVEDNHVMVVIKQKHEH